MMTIETGLDRFIAAPPALVTSTRIGLLTNPSGVDRHLRSAIDWLTELPAISITALYGPEHGVRGEAQAGEQIEGDTDARSGLPIYSLYGESRMPTAEMLGPIDVMVIDLQDIGVRFTTYISTVAHVLYACAEYDKQVVVLDRPNPLTGVHVAGNVLDPTFESFVGIHPIPILHGLTIGEFARLWARDRSLPPPHVVSMAGWQRTMWFDQTGLPWIPPSPNLPTLDSAMVFPGTCLLEGTNVSEGRGTTRPFEYIGAPWIDPDVFARSLTDLRLAGVSFRPIYFVPMFSKHAGERCGGVHIHVHERDAFDAVAFGPRLLSMLRRRYPDDFTWLAANDGEHFIDRLSGGDALRKTIDGNRSIERLLARWADEAMAFAAGREDILLY